MIAIIMNKNIINTIIVNIICQVIALTFQKSVYVREI